MAYIYDLADTWADGATTFTAVKMNVTDTASAAASNLLDLQVGGTSAFSINKSARASFGSASFRLGAADAASPAAQTFSVQNVLAGTTNTAGANLTIAGSRGTGTGDGGSILFQVAPAGSTGSTQNALVTALTISGNYINVRERSSAGLVAIGSANGTGLALSSIWVGLSIGQQGGIRTGGNAYTWINRSAYFGWTTSATTHDSTDSDTRLYRDAANTLAQRNDTNAQAFRLYNTFTDASNYERGFMQWASNVLRIGTEKAGTGSARALEFQTDGATRLTIDSTGQVLVTGNLGALSGTLNIVAGGARAAFFTGSAFILRSTASILAMGSDGTGLNPDLDFRRVGAGVARLSQNGTSIGGALEFIEMTAPAAPAADSVRIYAEDDGAGKTRLMARFATGAAVQIAIEP